MSIFKYKQKGYKYGVMRNPNEYYSASEYPVYEYICLPKYVKEEEIINFDDISGLTLHQVSDYFDISSSQNLVFVMYDCIHIINKESVWSKSNTKYDNIRSENQAIIRLKCHITPEDFKRKRNEIIDNVIVEKIIEYNKNKTISTPIKDRIMGFLEEYLYETPSAINEYVDKDLTQIPTFQINHQDSSKKQKREQNTRKKEYNNYTFGLLMNPNINHEDSFIGGFKPYNFVVSSHFLNFNNVYGLTIKEIGNYSSHIKNGKYMYFLMADIVPHDLPEYSIKEKMVRYYYEINTEQEKDQIIEELIGKALELELQEKRLEGSFYKRAQYFLDCYSDREITAKTYTKE